MVSGVVWLTVVLGSTTQGKSKLENFWLASGSSGWPGGGYIGSCICIHNGLWPLFRRFVLGGAGYFQPTPFEDLPSCSYGMLRKRGPRGRGVWGSLGNLREFGGNTTEC